MGDQILKTKVQSVFFGLRSDLHGPERNRLEKMHAIVSYVTRNNLRHNPHLYFCCLRHSPILKAENSALRPTHFDLLFLRPRPAPCPLREI